MGNRDYLQQLVGNRLSAVTFILDYLQLQFDHPTLTILTPIRVLPELGTALVAEGEEAFRNRLCEQIAKVVASVAYRPNDAMEITFQDGGMLSVSLESISLGCDSLYL